MPGHGWYDLPHQAEDSHQVPMNGNSSQVHKARGLPQACPQLDGKFSLLLLYLLALPSGINRNRRFCEK